MPRNPPRNPRATYITNHNSRPAIEINLDRPRNNRRPRPLYPPGFYIDGAGVLRDERGRPHPPRISLISDLGRPFFTGHSIDQHGRQIDENGDFVYPETADLDEFYANLERNNENNNENNNTNNNNENNNPTARGFSTARKRKPTAKQLAALAKGRRALAKKIKEENKATARGFTTSKIKSSRAKSSKIKSSRRKATRK